MKLTKLLKRFISGAAGTAMALTLLPAFSAFADEMSEKYQFTMFASSNADGAITVDSNNFCVNGKIATNGTVMCNENANVNVSKVEKVCAEMVYIPNKIEEDFFNGYNKEEVNEDYSLVETNIHIENPLSVNGVTELSGNITIDSGLKSTDDIYISGNVQNSSKTVIYSQYGNINFDSDNVNLNGLIYAPFGNINIKANNLTLNDTMIIANTITIEAPSVNVNYSERFGKYLGETSDTMEISEEDYKYFTDNNGNNIPDFFENSINWKYLKDSDGDGVPDIIEVNTGSNPNVSEEDYNNVLDSYTLEMMYNNPLLLYNYETNSLYIHGDISGNLILDIYDLFLMKRYVQNHGNIEIGDLDSDEDIIKRGDVDDDGDIDEEDVEYLSDYLIGKSKTLPAYYLNGVFTNKIGKLHEAAKVYLDKLDEPYKYNRNDVYSGKKDIWLVFMYLRSLGSYTTCCQEVEENPQKKCWECTGGAIDNGFINLIQTEYKNLDEYFKTFDEKNPGNYVYAYKDKDESRHIDLYHMAATMTALIYKTPKNENITHRKNYHNAEILLYLDGLAGIFGDASQLISDLTTKFTDESETVPLISVGNPNNFNVFKDNIGKIGNKNDAGVFSQADLLADIDAVNIHKKMYLKCDIEDVINKYYKTTSSRYTQFKKNILTNQDNDLSKSFCNKIKCLGFNPFLKKGNNMEYAEVCAEALAYVIEEEIKGEPNENS